MPAIVPKGQVVYGMQLPVQSRSRMYAETWEETSGTAEIAQLARAADESGFFYVAVCDHLGIPKGQFADAMTTSWYHTWTTLGYLAAITSNVRLLSHVSVPPYRHPLETSKAVMTLDTLSGGRAILGVGAGHLKGEFEALGVDFESRGALLDESLAIIDAALRDEFTSADGPTWKFTDIGQAPRPVQQPRPPIWVGGSGKPALRRAGEWDGWLPQGTPRAQMPEQIAYVLEHRAKTVGDAPLDIGTVCEFIYVGDPGWDVGEATNVGPAEKVAESLREFVAMGVNQLQVRFRSRSVDELADQMRAFGSDVAPLLS